MGFHDNIRGPQIVAALPLEDSRYGEVVSRRILDTVREHDLIYICRDCLDMKVFWGFVRIDLVSVEHAVGCSSCSCCDYNKLVFYDADDIDDDIVDQTRCCSDSACSGSDRDRRIYYEFVRRVTPLPIPRFLAVWWMKRWNRRHSANAVGFI